MAYLIDTNVLSESANADPDPGVMRWVAANDAQLYVSALTLGEMVKGIELLDAGRRRKKLEEWFARIERWSIPRTLALDAATMRRWGSLYAKHQRAGRKLGVMDSLLAASALENRLTLVTRNEGDFPQDVEVLNPWSGGGG